MLEVANECRLFGWMEASVYGVVAALTRERYELDRPRFERFLQHLYREEARVVVVGRLLSEKASVVGGGRACFAHERTLYGVELVRYVSQVDGREVVALQQRVQTMLGA